MDNLADAVDRLLIDVEKERSYDLVKGPAPYTTCGEVMQFPESQLYSNPIVTFKFHSGIKI